MRKILVAVDLQNDFIDGSLTVPGAADVIPVINAAKHDYDLVYFTVDWHSAGHCSFREQGGPWPVHCVHHTHGAAIPDCMLEGLPEGRMRFVLKGQKVEQYGAFADVTPSTQDYFAPCDEVTVCGIASEYCVFETVKNIHAIAKEVGFKLRVWLEGTAKFDNYDALLSFSKENGIEIV
ncbi:MAG: isochorismatase family protein [Bacteroidales bacterium]|nr:isochorismatase family protein [Bacteroidales bacterium]